MSHSDILKQLDRSDTTLRKQASQHIESGMSALMDGRRLITKCNLSQHEMDQMNMAYLQMMAAGNALRVFLQNVETHHQNLRSGWIDPRNGISKLIRAATSFDGDVENFLTLIRQIGKQRKN